MTTYYYGGGNPKRTVYRKLTDEKIDQARNLKEQGMTWKAIAEKLGISRITIYNHKLHKS